MGSLSRFRIVTEALLLAGNPTLETRAYRWLNAWLRSQYAAWPWPFLIKRAEGVALGAGVRSVTVGAGVGGVTPSLLKVRDPIYVYVAGLSSRVKARIHELENYPLGSDESTIQSTSTGMPSYFKVRAEGTTYGKWVLYPNVIPDRAYELAFDYQLMPDDISTDKSADSTIPIYPSDETMIQAVFVRALKYMKRYDEMNIENAELTAMKSGDRLKYGEVFGTNGHMGLDPAVFR